MSTRLQVNNLSWKTTDVSLKECFGKHGNVLHASVVRDPETQRSQGNGFVAFSDAEEAAAAEKALNGTDLDGNKIAIKKFEK